MGASSSRLRSITPWKAVASAVRPVTPSVRSATQPVDPTAPARLQTRWQAPSLRRPPKRLDGRHCGRHVFTLRPGLTASRCDGSSWGPDRLIGRAACSAALSRYVGAPVAESEARPGNQVADDP